MKEFGGFLGFGEELAMNEIKLKGAQYKALERVGVIIERAAKGKIAHLQPDAPPFGAWDELAESTIERKETTSAYALNEDGNPLLLTGEMRDSIEHCVLGETTHIGSNNDKAVWHELGTDRVPPRSFLGGAAAENADKIVKLIGGATVMALTGGIINSSLGEAFQDRIGILNDD